MALRSTPRNPLFDGRWFEDEIIIWCLRWYFRYKLSYRDLVEMMGERGLPVAHRRFYGGRSVTPRNSRSGGVATNVGLPPIDSTERRQPGSSRQKDLHALHGWNP